MSSGYVIVDKTTDDRIANLEAEIASQQAIISTLTEEKKKMDIRDIKIGDELPCAQKPGDVWYIGYGSFEGGSERFILSPEDGIIEDVKVIIKEFSCVCVDKSTNGLPIFNITISGKLENLPKNRFAEGIIICLKHNDKVEMANKAIRERDNYDYRDQYRYGAKIINGEFTYSFNTDLNGYFTISDYTEIELYRIAFADKFESGQ